MKPLDKSGSLDLVKDLDFLPFCTACPLAETRTRVVLGSGNHIRPLYMFIGEAPGETEDRTGMPFQGQAGRVLDEALLNVGVNRDDIYISNTVKCRPPKNRKPTKVETTACHPWLAKEITEVYPHNIILLGASAVKAVTGLELSAARERDDLAYCYGEFGDLTIPITAVYHPAACLHDPSKRVAFFEDIKRVVYGRDGGKRISGQVGTTERPILRRASTIDEIWHDLSRSDLLSVDIETTMDSSRRLLGVAISNGEKSAWITDLDKGSLFAHVCYGKQIVFHNAKFDMPVLVREGLLDWDDITIEDTYLMAYLLRREKLSLKTLAETDLGVKVVRLEDITLGKLDPSQVNQNDLGDYSCQDTELTLQLYHKYLAELKPTPMYAVYKHIDLPLIRVLAEMEAVGITVDTEHLQRLDLSMTQEKIDLVETIRSITDKPAFNPGSNEQVANLLYNELELPVYKTTPEGDPSTDAATLKKLQLEFPDIAFLDLELDYREIVKLHSTYVVGLGERAWLDPEHRIHTNFNMCVTETGRLSSSDPNLQNIPVRSKRGKLLRKAFIARPGWDLIVADQSQAEFRIVTCFSKDKRLINAYLEDRDIHMEVADILGVDRRTGKTLNFGLLYGMGVTKLANTLGISTTKAAKLQALYFEKVEGVKWYIEEAKSFALSHGYCETYFGRRQYLPGLYTDKGGIVAASFRSAVNTPIQGTAADIVRMIMFDVWRRFKEERLEAQILLQVHDELVIECPYHESRFVLDILDEASKFVLEPFSETFVIPMPMEGKICQSWADKG